MSTNLFFKSSVQCNPHFRRYGLRSGLYGNFYLLKGFDKNGNLVEIFQIVGKVLTGTGKSFTHKRLEPFLLEFWRDGCMRGYGDDA